MTTEVTETEQKVLGSHPLNPHPDGKAWTKCCAHPNEVATAGYRGCQCFMKKPRYEPASRYEADFKEVDSIKQLVAEGGRFFCIHRKDGEYHRECAGWFAKIRSKLPGVAK